MKQWMLPAALVLSAALVMPAAAQRQRKAGKTTRGQISVVSAEGFEIRTGTKKMPVATPTKVTTSSGTKILAIKTGAVADLKEKDLVVVVGEPGADGKIAATGILRLGDGDRMAATILSASARQMLSGGGRRAQKAAAALPPAPGTAPAPPVAARRKGNRAQVSQVVSISPLKVSQAGQTLEVVLPAGGPVAVVTPITLSDLKVGDTVTVVGTPGPDAAQPTIAAASFVVKNPGRRRKNQ